MDAVFICVFSAGYHVNIKFPNAEYRVNIEFPASMTEVVIIYVSFISSTAELEGMGDMCVVIKGSL